MNNQRVLILGVGNILMGSVITHYNTFIPAVCKV